ncbi:MAG: DNA polymerase III subunit alpha, partial [Anaerolineae bacterium]
MSDYVELHCHTNYSLLDGASHPEELLDRALELGMGRLAVTDHDGLYGAVRFYQGALQRGLKPIIGAELTLDGGYHLVLLAENNEGYSNLSRLISHAQLNHSKGQAALSFPTLARHKEGLICLSACSRGEIASHLLAHRSQEALEAARRHLHVFGRDHFFLELQHHLLEEDQRLVRTLLELAEHLGVQYVATNDVHYARREGHRLHDVLTCIANHTTLDEAGSLLRANSEYYLKSPEEMEDLFSPLPQAISNTRVIAERCEVDLNFSAHRLPPFELPSGEKAGSYLRRLCLLGVERKYKPVTERVRSQMNHELEVIGRTRLEEYFLIVWDICRYAHERGIPAQGRGSAANSLVAYVLDITRVDPIAHNLLFERFLSEEANTMPDIDVDFSTDHREEVIQYVYDKYGEEHTAMVSNVVTFRARSAVRDVGKALGFPLPLVDQVAKALDTRRASQVEEELQMVNRLAEKTTHLPWRQLLELCREIDSFPRHLSIHVGGMIITARPLVEIAPLERATMPGRVVVQFNK